MVRTDPSSPLPPVYPFNEPNQPISLYAGPIGGLGLADVPGVVQLSCTPHPSLEWSVRPVTAPEFANRPEVTLVLRRPDGDMQMPGWVRGIDIEGPNGTLSEAACTTGPVSRRAAAPLTRIST